MTAMVILLLVLLLLDGLVARFGADSRAGGDWVRQGHPDDALTLRHSVR